MTDGKIHMLGGAFINDINTQWKPYDESYKTELTDASMDNIFNSNRYIPDTLDQAAKFDDLAYNDSLTFEAEIGQDGAWGIGVYGD
jgi:hypothetical protein